MKSASNRIFKYLFPLCMLGFISAGAYVEKSADRPLAFVRKFKPNVGLRVKGQLKDIQKRGKPLYNGDTLQTDKNGFALVQFMDKSLAKVKPQSRLIVQGEIKGKQNTSTRIGLEAGEIFLNVAKQGSNDFEVASQSSVATVKGTKLGASADDYFWVQEGVVEVLANKTGQKVSLTKNMYGQVEGGTIETGELSNDEIKEKTEGYFSLNEQLEPTIYHLRFIDENGRQQVIDVKVFENDQ